MYFTGVLVQCLEQCWLCTQEALNVFFVNIYKPTVEYYMVIDMDNKDACSLACKESHNMALNQRSGCRHSSHLKYTYIMNMYGSTEEYTLIG